MFIVQVTGGNKGLGYETVRKLCKVFDGVVILTGETKQLCIGLVDEDVSHTDSSQYS